MSSKLCFMRACTRRPVNVAVRRAGTDYSGSRWTKPNIPEGSYTRQYAKKMVRFQVDGGASCDVLRVSDLTRHHVRPAVPDTDVILGRYDN